MTAQIDPDQIKQVFWNLATNAFEAMSTGGQLTISTSRRRVGSGERSGEVIEVFYKTPGRGLRKKPWTKYFFLFLPPRNGAPGSVLPPSIG